MTVLLHVEGCLHLSIASLTFPEAKGLNPVFPVLSVSQTPVGVKD